MTFAGGICAQQPVFESRVSGLCLWAGRNGRGKPSPQLIAMSALSPLMGSVLIDIANWIDLAQAAGVIAQRLV